MSEEAFHLRIEGRCPICERRTVFEAREAYLRNALYCTSCPKGSVPRERAVALALNETRPNWRTLAVHECSPAPRGLSLKLAAECARYVPSNYFEGEKFGAMVRGHRNENLESQTFTDETFDIVVTIDVFEHLFDPAAALREVYRTLKPGGVMISAFPMVKQLVEGTRWRAVRRPDGVENLLPEQWHGNPISEKGSLVTVDYGYDAHQTFAEWAPFDVRISRFAHRSAGILGEFTDVMICEKSV